MSYERSWVIRWTERLQDKKRSLFKHNRPNLKEKLRTRKLRWIPRGHSSSNGKRRDFSVSIIDEKIDQTYQTERNVTTKTKVKDQDSCLLGIVFHFVNF